MKVCRRLAADMNGDKLETITDLYMQISWWFHLPANLILDSLAQDLKLRTYWELGPANCSGTLATCASVAIWFGLLMLVLHIFDRILNFVDEADKMIRRAFRRRGKEFEPDDE